MAFTTSRRDFVKTATTSLIMPSILTKTAASLGDGDIVGHGSHRYKIQASWGKLYASKFPVKNCHEMVMDSKGRLIMVTDEIKNNILIFSLIFLSIYL